MPGLSFSASGIMCFDPSIFATMAFILGIVANSRCYLASVSIDEDSGLRALGAFHQEPRSFGLRCYESTSGTNFDISDLDLGSKIDAARALGWVS